MNESCFLEFGSLTYTQRAKALLSRNQINARLSRSGISNCSYGLFVKTQDLKAAKTVLDGAYFRYKV